MKRIWGWIFRRPTPTQVDLSIFFTEILKLSRRHVFPPRDERFTELDKISIGVFENPIFPMETLSIEEMVAYELIPIHHPYCGLQYSNIPEEYNTPHIRLLAIDLERKVNDFYRRAEKERIRKGMECDNTSTS